MIMKLVILTIYHSPNTGIMNIDSEGNLNWYNHFWKAFWQSASRTIKTLIYFDSNSTFRILF